MAERKHEYTSLWWNFGQYGRQDVHVHSCIKHSESCSDCIIGPGQDCDGQHDTHWRETYRGGSWVRLSEPRAGVLSLPAQQNQSDSDSPHQGFANAQRTPSEQREGSS